MRKVKLYVEVDEDLKNTADDLFNALGLDTETAVNIFLAASVREMGIPFHIGFNPDMVEDFDCDCDDECECKKNS